MAADRGGLIALSYLRRQMACTRAEFLSWLPGATRDAPVDIRGDVLTITIGDGSVQITVTESVPRRAGPISLPVLEVSISFSGIDESERSRFIEYFDLYTRRGGG